MPQFPRFIMCIIYMQKIHELIIWSSKHFFYIVFKKKKIKKSFVLSSDTKGFSSWNLPWQFSPTSEHILLAYGRRHSSLLKSVVIDGETTVPIYTILEVRVFSSFSLPFLIVLAAIECQSFILIRCFNQSGKVTCKNLC